MFHKPIIKLDNIAFIQLSFLSVLFPNIFPKKEKESLSRNDRRKITTFLIKYLEGTQVIWENVYKAYGATTDSQSTRDPLLREDIFDILLVCAPPAVIPWTKERIQYIQQVVPSFPAPKLFSNPSEPDNIPMEIDNMRPDDIHATASSNYTEKITSTAILQLIESDDLVQKFICTLTDVLNQNKDRKKKNTIVHELLSMLLPNLYGKRREDVEIELQCLLTLNNQQDLIARIRQLISCPYIRTAILPSRKILFATSRKMNTDFIDTLNPSRTPTGFRVDLCKFVDFVAFNVYKLTSLRGVRVDIYGDAMSRGKKDVVRMAFRILDAGLKTEQSSEYVFTFAVFDGKDVRVILESNLSMTTVVGEQGWLYEQTRQLHEKGVVVSLSGDSPFQLRLLKGVSMDNTLSKMCLYVAEDPQKVKQVLSNMKTGKDAKYDPKSRDPDEYKEQLEKIGVILPSTVDESTGRRTSLKIPIVESIPQESLIFLESTMHACPDVLHMFVRSVESDLKHHVERLLEKNDSAAILKLEDNITERNVKPPRFEFELSANKKTCEPISLSYRDAEVILSNPSQLVEYGRNDCELFEGVYSFETPHSYKEGQEPNSAYTIITTLNKNLETKIDGKECISIRKLADVQFSSLYMLLDLLRERDLKDLEKCEDLYETYYQATLILFGERALTPYKLKLDMLMRIFKAGKVLSPFFYKTEGTEKSHHNAKKHYHAKTMRDGGHDQYNMNSNFLDLQSSFYRAVSLALEIQNEETLRKTYSEIVPSVPASFSKSYLDICKEEMPKPVLDLTRTNNFFRGMTFIVLGNFINSTKTSIAPKDKITKTKKSGLDTKKKSEPVTKITQTFLEEKITAQMGKVLSNTDIIKRSKLRFLNHHYCILPNRNFIDTFSSTQGLSNDNTKSFYETTQGNWIYIKGEFIIDCCKINTLIDPMIKEGNDFKYLLEIDEKTKETMRKIKYISVPPQLQRQSQYTSATIAYHTAMRKLKTAKAKAKAKEEECNKKQEQPGQKLKTANNKKANEENHQPEKQTSKRKHWRV